MNKPDLHISDFDYVLPDDRIARFPLKQRDNSKLLIYKKGQIHETIFSNIVDYFSKDDLLVFNNTRVIQSRFLFKKPTGASVEIFCIEPVDPADYRQSLQSKYQVTWQCLIGNAKRWKRGFLEKSVDHNNKKVRILAEKLEKFDTTWLVKFSWEPDNFTFTDILEMAGLIPIPPYLKREPVPEDKITYQTVYSSVYGSVAAPTAGFHFTPEILDELKRKGIPGLELTLHVGAGTFRPVLSSEIQSHIMHSEHIYFNKASIRSLLEHNGKITSVGTTSARSLETIYWLGCKIKQNSGMDPAILSLDQWEDQNIVPVTKEASLETLFDYSERNSIRDFHVNTRLMIVPGYRYHMTDRIITNFHQPRSTLLLLVSAFIGDEWKKVYDYALKNNFRFLSYGDSSLLIPDFSIL
jgi:S-adenosylmethionine:tRNA ribosyltransferase-isomerase